jgi:hypothetical protein
MLRPMAAPSPQSSVSHFLHFGGGVSFRGPNGRALTRRIYFHTYAADNSCHQRRRRTEKIQTRKPTTGEVRWKVLRTSHWFQMSKLNGIIIKHKTKGPNIQMSYPLHVSRQVRRRPKRKRGMEQQTPARSPAVGPRLVAHTPTRALAAL